MDGKTNSVGALCYNEGKECGLCKKMYEEYQNNNDTTIKIGLMKIEDQLYPNVKGCEKDNLIIHYSGLFDAKNQIEYISRARKRLILIIDSKDLDYEQTFFKVLKELRNHSETCQNDMCKEHKWNRKGVIEFVEMGEKEEPFWNNLTIAISGIGVVGIMSFCVLLYVKSRKAIR